ncbi:hypothetical protein NQ318_001821 [Aromia moschata]|uniref:Uncharacterized protein n=1 Tax=Aromia moschata TaxID=1265417 RepID=A0AAV8Z2P6_9CUCU|nr:hypothetical protein NQ318_001821 [Aromia moschata]
MANTITKNHSNLNLIPHSKLKHEHKNFDVDTFSENDDNKTKLCEELLSDESYSAIKSERQELSIKSEEFEIKMEEHSYKRLEDNVTTPCHLETGKRKGDTMFNCDNTVNQMEREYTFLDTGLKQKKSIKKIYSDPSRTF